MDGRTGGRTDDVHVPQYANCHVVGGDKETTSAAAAAASSDLVLYGGERGGRKIEGGGKKWVVDWVIGGERENGERREGGSEPDGFHCHFKVLVDDKSRPTDGRPSE